MGKEKWQDGNAKTAIESIIKIELQNHKMEDFDLHGQGKKLSIAASQQTSALIKTSSRRFQEVSSS